MSYCSKCDKEVRPIQDFQPNGRIIDCCPTCTSAVAPDEPKQMAAVDVAVKMPIAAPEPARKRVDAAPATVDILGAAKARLEAVRAQLASHEALLSEAAMLERMISAAEANR